MEAGSGFVYLYLGPETNALLLQFILSHAQCNSTRLINVGWEYLSTEDCRLKGEVKLVAHCGSLGDWIGHPRFNFHMDESTWITTVRDRRFRIEYTAFKHQQITHIDWLGKGNLIDFQKCESLSGKHERVRKGQFVRTPHQKSTKDPTVEILHLRLRHFHVGCLCVIDENGCGMIGQGWHSDK
jgi:hypothetical protein